MYFWAPNGNGGGLACAKYTPEGNLMTRDGQSDYLCRNAPKNGRAQYFLYTGDSRTIMYVDGDIKNGMIPEYAKNTAFSYFIGPACGLHDRYNCDEKAYKFEGDFTFDIVGDGPKFIDGDGLKFIDGTLTSLKDNTVLKFKGGSIV